MDVLDDPGDHRLERLARHVAARTRGSRALGGRLGPRQRAGEPLAHLGDRSRARASPSARRRRRWRARDRVLEVVEDDEHVGEHQRQVGQAERVGVGLAAAARRCARSRSRRSRPRRRRTAAGRRAAPGGAGDRGGGDRVRVAVVAERPAHDLARPEADERVAADALALLGRLEQERRAGAAQLEERRDRRLAVVDEEWTRARATARATLAARRQRRRPSSTRLRRRRG